MMVYPEMFLDSVSLSLDDDDDGNERPKQTMDIHIHTSNANSSSDPHPSHPLPSNTPSHPPTTYFFGSSVKIPSASNLLLASSKAQV